jgi:Holliday junction resolvasome RuvABC endonuclease subunit
MAGGILALDLATRTGWAFAGPAALESWPGSEIEAAAMPTVSVVYGSYRMPKTGPDVGWFLDSFHNWLTGDLEVHQPEMVVFEAPWVGPKTHQDTARKLMCLAGHCEFVCRRMAIQYREANNATVRKHFLGTGRGDRRTLKRLAMEACRRRGWDPENDDEADALGLLDYAAACWRPARVAA